MFCDVDRFKQINDSFGHVIGDGVLQSIADSMVRAVRAGDTVARLGGDEVVVLLPQMKWAKDASGVARKVLKTARLKIPQGSSCGVEVTLSIGIALYEEGDNDDTLMHRADNAMYRVKERGGDGVELLTQDAPIAD